MNSQVDPSLKVSVGVVADLQYCDAAPFKDRYYRNSISKLNYAIEVFNSNPLDAIFNLGDTIDHDWSSFEAILPVFEKLKAPVYHVLGNHDFEVADIYKALVPEKIGAKKYYDFGIGNWRFAVLDGNEISTFSTPENSKEYILAEKLLAEMAGEQKINANFWNGAIGDNQFDWLQKVLEKATANHEKVLVFCHFPVFPKHRHNLLNDEKLVQELQKYSCVKACFSGHNHHGNYGFSGGIHFVNLKGMVESEHEMAFSLIELSSDAIVVKGFGSESSYELDI